MQQVAQGLASLGRGGDTQLVHMTPGEVHGLQALAMSHGGSLTINPETGLPEANMLRSILPMVLGAGAMMIPGAQGIGAGWLAAGFGGLSALASGNWKQGLSDGLGFFGGANLTNSLSGMGASEIEKAKLLSSSNTNALNLADMNGSQGLRGLASNSPDFTTALGRGPEFGGLNSSGVNAERFFAPGMSGDALTSIPQSADIAGRMVNPYLGNNALNAAGQAGADSLVRAGAPLQVQAPSADPSVFDKAKLGVQQLGTGQGWKDLYGKVGFGGASLLAAPIASELMKQPTLGNNTAAAVNKGSIRPYQYTTGQVNPEAQRQIAQFGFSKVPYFSGQGYTEQPVYAAAAGGQVPQPSMPIDLSQNYPGSNITKSSYATLPSTDSQEVVDGYGPKINPFTGAEGMAEGGPVGRLIAQMKIDKQGAFADPREEAMQYQYNPEDQQYTQMAAGGIASLPEYAAGGKLLRGPGDGMSDDIPAVIKGKTPQRAALADGEFVVPADVVSHLGNGSTDAGAKRLYSMMDRVRKARTGNPKQGKQITAERFMPA